MPNYLCWVNPYNTSHSIILHEYISNLEDQPNSSTEISKLQTRRKLRTLYIKLPDSLPECSVTPKANPTMMTNSTERFHFYKLSYNSQLLNIPRWAGFICSVGNKPSNLTIIDCYPMNNHPIIDFKIVQECLKYSEEFAKELIQRYVITTFDLGLEEPNQVIQRNIKTISL